MELPESMANYFDAKFREHRASVLGYLLSRCHDQEQAEDMLQATFLRSMEWTARTGKNINDFRNFIFFTATMVSIDFYRRDLTRKNYMDSYMEKCLEKLLENLSSNERILTVNRIYELLHSDLLPDRQLSILRLFYIDNFSVDEIVKLLQMSRPTVYRELKAGREKLRNALIA